ncbi:hypothetical protein COU77_04125 [Candidatus Peregrinibacteria bacterium CG10_big_fil_rev_8_21_14_0_10_49_16]|nr:MAG: hypothetical protein COW95_03225 [Candidatus Peregrinibacteria bacterium CG22_combo_CG10-13_8_21_14_all_49_11]PIR51722.1 MAG: hypothetical protein COU77_04125 [Candidatus Peregrinibacteria bacterium CG10_big_fil_rev_8_21_14_0_10_49_16]
MPQRRSPLFFDQNPRVDAWRKKRKERRKNERMARQKDTKGQNEEKERAQPQKQKGQNTRPRKKMGLFMAFLFFLTAFFYDALDVITTVFGDDYWILDLLFFPPSVFWWVYFRVKHIRKRGLVWFAYCVELLPLLDVLNFQMVYAIIIILTNRSEKLARLTEKMPGPSKGMPKLKAAS